MDDGMPAILELCEDDSMVQHARPGELWPRATSIAWRRTLPRNAT
jgi:hypothetical protein